MGDKEELDLEPLLPVEETQHPNQPHPSHQQPHPYHQQQQQQYPYPQQPSYPPSQPFQQQPFPQQYYPPQPQFYEQPLPPGAFFQQPPPHGPQGQWSPQPTSPPWYPPQTHGYASENMPAASPEAEATYALLERSFKTAHSVLYAVAVVQMVLWFPLGFLFFIGLTPRCRGHQQMAVGIAFLILSIFTGGFVVMILPLAYLIVLYLVLASLAACSVGFGVWHSKIEKKMRAINEALFVSTYKN